MLRIRSTQNVSGDALHHLENELKKGNSEIQLNFSDDSPVKDARGHHEYKFLDRFAAILEGNSIARPAKLTLTLLPDESGNFAREYMYFVNTLLKKYPHMLDSTVRLSCEIEPFSKTQSRNLAMVLPARSVPEAIRHSDYEDLTEPTILLLSRLPRLTGLELRFTTYYDPSLLMEYLSRHPLRFLEYFNFESLYHPIGKHLSQMMLAHPTLLSLNLRNYADDVPSIASVVPQLKRLATFHIRQSYPRDMWKKLENLEHVYIHSSSCSLDGLETVPNMLDVHAVTDNDNLTTYVRFDRVHTLTMPGNVSTFTAVLLAHLVQLRRLSVENMGEMSEQVDVEMANQARSWKKYYSDKPYFQNLVSLSCIAPTWINSMSLDTTVIPNLQELLAWGRNIDFLEHILTNFNHLVQLSFVLHSDSGVRRHNMIGILRLLKKHPTLMFFSFECTVQFMVNDEEDDVVKAIQNNLTDSRYLILKFTLNVPWWSLLPPYQKMTSALQTIVVNNRRKYGLEELTLMYWKCLQENRNNQLTTGPFDQCARAVLESPYTMFAQKFGTIMPDGTVRWPWVMDQRMNPQSTDRWLRTFLYNNVHTDTWHEDLARLTLAYNFDKIKQEAYELEKKRLVSRIETIKARQIKLFGEYLPGYDLAAENKMNMENRGTLEIAQQLAITRVQQLDKIGAVKISRKRALEDTGASADSSGTNMDTRDAQQTSKIPDNMQMNRFFKRL